MNENHLQVFLFTGHIVLHEASSTSGGVDDRAQLELCDTEDGEGVATTLALLTNVDQATHIEVKDASECRRIFYLQFTALKSNLLLQSTVDLH